jgi:hypothetical protein
MTSFVGTNPNQVPTNSDLGRLAFLDYLGWDDTGAAIPVIASASVITPNLKITKVSGTAIINTITVPLDFINGGDLVLIPTGRFSFDTTGNIALSLVAEVSKPITMTYDAVGKKWYPSYSNTINNLNVNASLSNNVSMNVGTSVTINGTDNLTLSNVVISSVTGNFGCAVANNTLVVGKQVTITGTNTGTGVVPNGVYYIVATNGSVTFQLSATFGGNPIATTVGSTTGLTFTCAPVLNIGRGGDVVYNDNTSKLTAFASTTSSELAGVISDYTGTAGNLVYSGGPTLTGTVLVTGNITLNDTGSVINVNSTNPSIVTTSAGTASVFNTGATTGNIFNAATTTYIGYTGTAASTTNISTGATLTSTTKAINIGTNGNTGSTTNISIGSSAGGTTTVNNALNVVVGGNTYPVGYANVPQVIQNADFSAFTLNDMGKHYYHASATAHTYTVPAGVFAIGATLMFVNRGAGVLTIRCDPAPTGSPAPATESLLQSITGSTGSRALAAFGVATMVKITATEWIISGTGLS